MKIGFYLQNHRIRDVDCTEPMKGNPGIGGTEYMFIGIPYSLWNDPDNNHDVWLLANHIENLPASDKCIQVESDLKLGEVIEQNGFDAVVVRHSRENMEFVSKLPPDVKVILWAHNFMERYDLSILAEDKRIACIVCVGNEQLQMYRDHSAFYKSVVIFNGYPVSRFINNELKGLMPFSQRKNEVTYLGALVKFKGFHILAAAWKRIVAEVPDAHLNVIGGRKLYDRNMKLGKYGIADESYEDTFMPYLIGDNGKILPSVTFHGVLGNEKSEIMGRTKVGVPNPSGAGETFCLSALELQLYGAVISTINYGGFKDTVYKTGILYDNPDELAECIISQLRYKDNDYKQFAEFAGDFDFGSVTKKWIILFDVLQHSGSLRHVLKPQSSKGHRLEECNRLIKKILPFGKYLPTLMYYRALCITLKDRAARLFGK